MSDKETPQGSILSPILANIFSFTCIDEWFENVVKFHTKDIAIKLGYGDDFVCLVSLKKQMLKNRKKDLKVDCI